MLNLIRRPDFEGFGFSIRKFDKGPHQIAKVDKNSPAEYAGVRVNDLLLKINNVEVVEAAYAKIGLIITNEFEKHGYNVVKWSLFKVELKLNCWI